MKHVTSRHNALVARYRAVARGDERERMLLDGPHLVAEALRAPVVVRQAAVTAGGLDRDEVRALVDDLQRRGIEVVRVSAPVMAAVSPLRSPSEIVAIADRPDGLEQRLYAGRAPLVVMACDVQDPGNLGAIVRVVEAAGAAGVVAAGRSADPFGWKALRGSMGSALRLSIVTHKSADDAIREARRHACRIVATIPRAGRTLFDVDLKRPTVILVGGEGGGLGAELVGAADERITIPMQPPVESLNTAITAALVIYEARRQRDAASFSRRSG